MADSSLNAIRTKVRRLTRSLSTSQLSDAQLDEYINTFILYDFPEHLKHFNLQTTFSFYLQPGIDTYDTNTTNTSDPLYNFKNRYLTILQPMYIAGRQIQFLESREQFFGEFPNIRSIASIGLYGDGITTSFPGYVANAGSSLILQNEVLFDSIDINSAGISMIDYPISNTIGNLYVPGGTPTSTTLQDPVNYINYATGQFVVTFPTPPGVNMKINSQVVIVQPTLPQAVLFYDGKFTFRPVPDQPYQFNVEVFKRPTELIAANQSPDLEEWWQYIAYGTSIKIFQDKMDLESVQLIMPEFRRQELLVNRRTINQIASQRASTIYSDGTNIAGTLGQGWF